MSKKLSGVEVFEQADPSVLLPDEAVLSVGSTKAKSILNRMFESGPGVVVLVVFMVLSRLVGALVLVGVLSLIDLKVNPRPPKGSLAATWPRQHRLVALTSQRILFAKDRGKKPIKAIVHEFSRSSVRSIRKVPWKGLDLLQVEFVDGSTVEALGDPRGIAAQFQITTGQSASRLPPPPPIPSENVG